MYNINTIKYKVLSCPMFKFIKLNLSLHPFLFIYD